MTKSALLLVPSLALLSACSQTPAAQCPTAECPSCEEAAASEESSAEASAADASATEAVAAEPVAACEDSSTSEPVQLSFSAGSVDKETLIEANAWAVAQGKNTQLLNWATIILPLSSETKTTLSLSYNSVESPSEATLVLTEEGYMDDSVRAGRFTLKFKTIEGDPTISSLQFELVSAEQAIQCHKGRGHQDFTSAPCN